MKTLYKEDVLENLMSHAVCWGVRYKHFKGGFYVGICEAKMESTGESMIVYQCEKTKEIWMRPVKEFYDAVKYEGRVVDRFVPYGMAKNKPA